jgi:hypothetical protein
MGIVMGKALGCMVGNGIESTAVSFGGAADAAEFESMVVRSYVDAPTIEEPTARQMSSGFSFDIAERVAKLRGEQAPQQARLSMSESDTPASAGVGGGRAMEAMGGKAVSGGGSKSAHADLMPIIEELKKARVSADLTTYSQAELDDLKSTVLRELNRVIEKGSDLYTRGESASIRAIKDDRQRNIAIQCLKEDGMSLHSVQRLAEKLEAVDVAQPKFWKGVADAIAQLHHYVSRSAEGKHRPTKLLAHVLYYGGYVVTPGGFVEKVSVS